MFENVGEKIMAMAKVFTWIGIVASFIAGVVIWVDSEMVMVGFLVMGGGGIVSWLSSLTLYGFGQLIVNTDEMVNKAYERNRDCLYHEEPTKKKSVYAMMNEVYVEHPWRCDKCGTLTTGETCHNCNAKR